jgi:RHS repeat-associated protein
VTGSQITKYYYAGAQKIAMRQNGILSFILGDHLGSTSLVTNPSGIVISETQYKAWGEVRYASGASPTKYTFTGQYTYTSDFGLMFYNARWYDPVSGRFNQPDSIIPEQSQGTQAWDRYAYANNNSVRYNDPTGHWGFDLSAIVNSIVSINFTNPVNRVLSMANSGKSITNTDVANGCDAIATALDVGAAAISSAIAAGEVASAAIGYSAGAAITYPVAGEASVAFGIPGAAVAVGIFELSPEVRIAAAVSDGMGWASTGFTALSDIITGDTNITGSVSVSDSSIDITQSSSIGRDTASTLYLSGLGQMAPLGIIDAPIDYVGLAFDAGIPWKRWPFSEVPESIPVTNLNIEIPY